MIVKREKTTLMLSIWAIYSSEKHKKRDACFGHLPKTYEKHVFCLSLDQYIYADVCTHVWALASWMNGKHKENTYFAPHEFYIIKHEENSQAH